MSTELPQAARKVLGVGAQHKGVVNLGVGQNLNEFVGVFERFLIKCKVAFAKRFNVAFGSCLIQRCRLFAALPRG